MLPSGRLNQISDFMTCATVTLFDRSFYPIIVTRVHGGCGFKIDTNSNFHLVFVGSRNESMMLIMSYHMKEQVQVKVKYHKAHCS